jgi:hypothetical protein
LTEKETKNEFKPALLTRTELEWLSDKIQLSKPYQRWLRHNIKKKLANLAQLELPLLISKGFIKNNDNDDISPVDSVRTDSNYSALVRQGSRVQIPAKASFLRSFFYSMIALLMACLDNCIQSFYQLYAVL